MMPHRKPQTFIRQQAENTSSYPPSNLSFLRLHRKRCITQCEEKGNAELKGIQKVFMPVTLTAQAGYQHICCCIMTCL